MKRIPFLMITFGSLLLAITLAFADLPSKERPVTAYTLRTDIQNNKRVFVGVGGKIDGVVNPDLFVTEWDIVEITLVNSDGLSHHIAIPDFSILSDEVMGKGMKTVIAFVPFKKGNFVYYCELENHRQLGMEGRLIVVSK